MVERHVPKKSVNVPPSPPAGWTLYSVLPDTQTPRWDYQVRTLHPAWEQPFPETAQVVPLTTVIGLEEETRFTVLPDKWQTLFRQLNYGDPARFDWVTANDTAWFNHPPFDRSSGWRDGMESLAMGAAPGLWDNVLACRPTNSPGWMEVLTLRPWDSTAGISRELTPWFVHRFTAVGHKRNDNNRPYWADSKHGDCYAVLVTNKPVFIRRDWLGTVWYW